MRKSGAKRDQQSVFVSNHREHRDKVQKIDNFRKKKSKKVFSDSHLIREISNINVPLYPSSKPRRETRDRENDTQKDSETEADSVTV